MLRIFYKHKRRLPVDLCHCADKVLTVCFKGLLYKNLLFPLRGEWPLHAINLPL